MRPRCSTVLNAQFGKHFEHFSTVLLADTSYCGPLHTASRFSGLNIKVNAVKHESDAGHYVVQSHCIGHEAIIGKTRFLYINGHARSAAATTSCSAETHIYSVRYVTRVYRMVNFFFCGWKPSCALRGSLGPLIHSLAQSCESHTVSERARHRQGILGDLRASPTRRFASVHICHRRARISNAGPLSTADDNETPSLDAYRSIEPRVGDRYPRNCDYRW